MSGTHRDLFEFENDFIVPSRLEHEQKFSYDGANPNDDKILKKVMEFIKEEDGEKVVELLRYISDC